LGSVHIWGSSLRCCLCIDPPCSSEQLHDQLDCPEGEAICQFQGIQSTDGLISTVGMDYLLAVRILEEQGQVRRYVRSIMLRQLQRKDIILANCCNEDTLCNISAVNFGWRVIFLTRYKLDYIVVW
jgi:hypothetical protein